MTTTPTTRPLRLYLAGPMTGLPDFNRTARDVRVMDIAEVSGLSTRPPCYRADFDGEKQ